MTVTAARGPRYDWARLTYPRGRADGAYRDEDGWVLPAPPWFFPNREALFAPLSQLRHEPVIVLASASGIGKSTALEQEHEALTPAAACLVDLRELIDHPAPVAFLAGRTRPPEPATEGGWHVLLDGFDEAVKRRSSLVAVLDSWLGGLPGLEGLRLRVATRPGVPENTMLEEALGRHWPADAVVVRDMAPLNRSDVLQAAQARGIADPEGFTAKLEQRGLVPVASLPVTLTVLLERAAEGESFPATARRVYELACEYLCEETSPGRSRPQGLGLRELMRSAAHLAAVLEFCGNGVLTDELDAADLGPVRLVDVADAIGAGSGGQAEDALRWLTGTPLLRSLSGSHWQFADQGIQSYLAARHLQDRGVALATLRSLLLVGPGQDLYVSPRHRDVAGWLAWRRPDLYGEILGRDPWALLSPDLAAQPDQVRAEVAEALLAHAAGGAEPSRLRDLHRADHPGLGGQLAAMITPQAARAAAGPEPVRLALALAQACPGRAPDASLLDVAEDDQASPEIRAAAIEAVPATAGPEEAVRLRALAGSPEPRVAAAALLALWPDRLPTPDFLDLMPEAAPGLYWRRAELRLRADDAAEVTVWMTRQFKNGVLASAAKVLRLLPWAAAALSPAGGDKASQPAAAQLAEVLALLLGSDHAYSIEISDVRDAWAADQAWRRLLAGEVLARLDPQNTEALGAAEHDHMGLFPLEDSVYWARKAAADGAPAALGGLILRYPGDTPELEEIRVERQGDPRLEEVTARWFGPEPTWVRVAEEQAAERTAEISSTLGTLAAERPAPDQVRPWWISIVYWLNRDPRNFHQQFAPVRLDLTAAPSFPPAGTPLRPALQEAALHAAGQAPTVTAADVPSIVDAADACEVSALSVLDGPPDLTPERWAGIALALAFANWPGHDHDQSRDLLAHASAAAGDAFTGALPDALSAVTPARAANAVATLAAAALGGGADAALLGWADAPGRPVGTWCEAMRALAPHDRATLPVLGLLAGIADRAMPDSPDERLRWAEAVDLMLLHGPRAGIGARWEQVLSSEEATTAWAQAADSYSAGFSLDAHAPVAYWPAAYRLLTPRQAAILYGRLARQGLVTFPTTGPVLDISGPGRRGIHSRLPDLIAAHVTEDAARELQALAAQFPQHSGLPGQAAALARQAGENPPPLTLAELTALTGDPASRIVRTAADLAQVVLDALATLQEQALRSHGWSTLMWNREDEDAATGWWPAWEDTLSNLVSAFLREHLVERKPVINREVEIQPGGLSGGRTDLLVQAADPRGGACEPLTVIIESKGCWNREISTGIAGQLAPYLRPRPGWTGIFLVGYFHHPGGEHTNYIGSPKAGAVLAKRGRHRTPKGHQSAQIRADLGAQAGASEEDVRVFVLELPLVPPAATGPAAPPP